MALEDELDYDRIANAAVFSRTVMIIGLMMLVVVLFYMAINMAVADKEACMRFVNSSQKLLDTSLNGTFTIR